MFRCLTLFACLSLAAPVSAADPPRTTASCGSSSSARTRTMPSTKPAAAGRSGRSWGITSSSARSPTATSATGRWPAARWPQRRTAEVAACSKVLGTTSKVLDIHDGELEPTLENRKKIIRVIREWKADIVIAHRPWDYHPDHRYVGVLVQDAAYMVTVPFFCPDTPILTKNPVFLYSSDGFQKPYPFNADVAVSIDDVFEQKLDAHPRTGVAALRRRGQRQRGPRPLRPAGQRRRRPQSLAPQASGSAAAAAKPTASAPT